MPNHTLRKYGNNYFKTLIIIINTNSVPPRIFPGLSADATVNIQTSLTESLSLNDGTVDSTNMAMVSLNESLSIQDAINKNI